MLEQKVPSLKVTEGIIGINAVVDASDAHFID